MHTQPAVSTDLDISENNVTTQIVITGTAGVVNEQ
jgi:hypothetical protein